MGKDFYVSLLITSTQQVTCNHCEHNKFLPWKCIDVFSWNITNLLWVRKIILFLLVVILHIKLVKVLYTDMKEPKEPCIITARIWMPLHLLCMHFDRIFFFFCRRGSLNLEVVELPLFEFLSPIFITLTKLEHDKYLLMKRIWKCGLG